MPAMVRKQMYIQPDQERRLKRIARKSGKTEAELLRQGLDRILDDMQRAEDRRKAWAQEKEFIRHWIAKGPVPSGRRWTRDELHER